MARRAMSRRPLVFVVFQTLNIVVYCLIMIGSIPVLFIKSLFWLFDLLFSSTSFFLRTAVRKILSIDIKSGSRKRGRPRIQPILPFYFHKVSKFYSRVFPRSTRWKVALGILVVILSFYSYFLVKLTANLPSPYQLTSNNSPLTTQIYDRKGRLLYQFYEGRNRKLVNLSELPPDLIHATIAMEDRHFYSHPGVDIFGMARALYNNYQNKGQGELQGGSTITQQLIKNTLLTPDQTWARKAKEVLLAFWAERIYSKDEILQAYFNESPYGGPAWGIEAASEMYFGKSAHDLTLAESSYLAGLPAAPTEYSPYGTHPEKAKERQQDVLARMVDDHYITKQQADQAYNSQLDIKSPSQTIKAPHFVMYIRSLLADRYGERAVSQGGLKVITSLDLDIQNMAENVVQNDVKNLASLNVGNGAAMILDSKTGQILAMVGSKDYFDKNSGNYNVTLALRQPGSSIKPITYVTGFMQGYTPGTIMLDNPITFKNGWESYTPVNYDGKFHGPVTIRTALGSSYNIPAVKMLAIVGIPQMIDTAQNMGITTLNDPSKYGLSLTLGGGAVRMIDMMTVYDTLANYGTRLDTQPILTVTDASGNILEDNTNPTSKKVIPEEVAYLVTSILSDPKARIPAFGPNSLLEIPGHTVAVKTGTSDDKRDNWAFGYTPDYVVGAWVGNNDNSPMNPALTSGITGATPIWHDLMTALLEGTPNISFRKPDKVIDGTVDGNKDLVIAGNTTKSVVSLKKTTQKDEATGNDKESITYFDPFTTFNAAGAH